MAGTQPAGDDVAAAHVRDGRSEVADHLLPAVYDELHALAGALLRRRRASAGVQATSLIHEAYIRLVNHGDLKFNSRAHFLGVAAKAMRCVLVDHARRRSAGKRGGGRQAVSLEADAAISAKPDVDVIAVDEALNRLMARDERKGRMVELRFFGGLTVEETAEVLEISPATVKREWSVAKAWLAREMELT